VVIDKIALSNLALGIGGSLTTIITVLAQPHGGAPAEHVSNNHVPRHWPSAISNDESRTSSSPPIPAPA
jgi:hypothetical protein